MNYIVELHGHRYVVEIVKDGVVIDGVAHRVRLQRFDDSPGHVLELEGQRFPVVVEPADDRKWVVSIYGDRREVLVLDERAERARRLRAGSGAERTIRPLMAPMPGLVIRVPAAPGQEVEEGSSLVVLEAMKMENDLKAAARAVIEQVHVRPGQPVEKGDLLISFREDPPSA